MRRRVIYGRFFSIFSLQTSRSNMAGPEQFIVPGLVTLDHVIVYCQKGNY